VPIRKKRSRTTPGNRPEVIEDPGTMLASSRRWRAAGKAIGLVPTMGALHAGHLSLVELACGENAIVVVSIFVNPRDPEHDEELRGQAGIDAIYRPSAAVMYPPGAATRVRVVGVSETLEGAARPGHFEGVATVVTKLLAAVQPDRAYFGQKDAQQAAVVRRLARDLDLGVEIRVAPTVREADGLALSSRNVYLDPGQRKAAASLSAALRRATDAYATGERRPEALREMLRARLEAEPLARVDHAEVVDPVTFQPPGTLAVLAAWIGKTRLIDNHDLSQPFPG